jgi:ComF family protein
LHFLSLHLKNVTPRPNFPATRDRPPSGIQKALDGLLNLIYPETCFICSMPVSRRQDFGICSICWNKALSMKILPPLCPSCGLPYQNYPVDTGYLCGNCLLGTPPYAGARAFGYYAEELSRLIQGMKFHGRTNLIEPLAALLTDSFFMTWEKEEFDFLTPIPLHRKRKRERGYNQSELLARALARYIAVPFNPALQRIRTTLPQVGLTDAQRRENVRKAFQLVNPTQIINKRILLIDDVMTTGATVSSAAQTLLDGGALRISVLTIARAVK